jgi:hypothetical protein
MQNLRAWARQPTTVAGFSALIAAISALVLKQLSLAQAIPVLAGALMSMVLPDSTGAQQQATSLATEVVSTFSTKKAPTP